MCVIITIQQDDLITDSNNAIVESARVYKQFVDNVNKISDGNVGISLHSSSSSSRLPPSHYFYLGFDKKIESGPILIYFSLVEKSGVEVNRDDIDVGDAQNFYYYSLTG